MRTTFLNTLFDLAKQDSRIVFITGDLVLALRNDSWRSFPSNSSTPAWPSRT